MTVTRFKSNRRLWLILSTILFAVPWFVPTTQNFAPWHYCAALVFLPFDQDPNPDHLIFALQGIIVFTLMFGIPALAIGWVLQCVVVIIQSLGKGERHGRN